MRQRAALEMVAAGLSVSASIGLPGPGDRGLRLPAVSQPGYEAVVAPAWSAAADLPPGSTRFVTVAQDLLVIIQPAAAAGAEGLGEVTSCGARPAELVEVTQRSSMAHLRSGRRGGCLRGHRGGYRAGDHGSSGRAATAARRRAVAHGCRRGRLKGPRGSSALAASQISAPRHRPNTASGLPAGRRHLRLRACRGDQRRASP